MISTPNLKSISGCFDKVMSITEDFDDNKYPLVGLEQKVREKMNKQNEK